MVGMAGFEPATSCSQSRRANQAALHPGGPAVAYLLPAPRSWLHSAGAHIMCRPAGGRAITARGHSDQSGATRRYATGSDLRPVSPGAAPRGRSSMAEPQPSKLVMRVRFPSPAPSPAHRSRPRSGPCIDRLRLVLRTLTTSFVPATCHCRASVGLRSSPRADRCAPTPTRKMDKSRNTIKRPHRTLTRGGSDVLAVGRCRRAARLSAGMGTSASCPARPVSSPQGGGT